MDKQEKQQYGAYKLDYASFKDNHRLQEEKSEFIFRKYL